MKYKISLVLAIGLALITSCNIEAKLNDTQAKTNQTEINEVTDNSVKKEDSVEDNKVDKEENKISKEELFSKLDELPDLESYKIETNVEKIAKANSDNPEVISNTIAKLEFMKDPYIYHALYQIHDPAVGEMETETYQNGAIAVTRQDANGWMKTEIPEDESNANSNGQNNTIVRELDDYYTVSETDDYYIIGLETTPENLNEIKDLIMEGGYEQIFDGELTTIRIIHKYDKKNLYPISFDLEAESINEAGDLTLYKNNDIYKEVNAVDEIIIPDEVKALLEE